MKNYYVYIMASGERGTLYLGVTNDITRRVYEHKSGVVPGFTEKHGLKYLVWYEVYDSIEAAIQREKTMKQWYRRWKIELIEKENPDWQDLYDILA